MTCNVNCHRYNVTKGNITDSWYKQGLKRCSTYDIYIKWDGLSLLWIHVTKQIQKQPVQAEIQQKFMMLVKSWTLSQNNIMNTLVTVSYCLLPQNLPESIWNHSLRSDVFSESFGKFRENDRIDTELISIIDQSFGKVSGNS